MIMKTPIYNCAWFLCLILLTQILVGCSSVNVTSYPEGATVYLRSSGALRDPKLAGIPLYKSPRIVGTTPLRRLGDKSEESRESVKVVWPDGTASGWVDQSYPRAFSSLQFHFNYNDYVDGPFRPPILPAPESEATFIIDQPSDESEWAIFHVYSVLHDDNYLNWHEVHIAQVDFQRTFPVHFGNPPPQTVWLTPGYRTVDIVAHRKSPIVGARRYSHITHEFNAEPGLVYVLQTSLQGNTVDYNFSIGPITDWDRQESPIPPEWHQF